MFSLSWCNAWLWIINLRLCTLRFWMWFLFWTIAWGCWGWWNDNRRCWLTTMFFFLLTETWWWWRWSVWCYYWSRMMLSFRFFNMTIWLRSSARNYRNIYGITINSWRFLNSLWCMRRGWWCCNWNRDWCRSWFLSWFITTWVALWSSSRWCWINNYLWLLSCLWYTLRFYVLWWGTWCRNNYLLWLFTSLSITFLLWTILWWATASTNRDDNRCWTTRCLFLYTMRTKTWTCSTTTWNDDWMSCLKLKRILNLLYNIYLKNYSTCEVWLSCAELDEKLDSLPPYEGYTYPTPKDSTSEFDESKWDDDLELKIKFNLCNIKSSKW